MLRIQHMICMFVSSNSNYDKLIVKEQYLHLKLSIHRIVKKGAKK